MRREIPKAQARAGSPEPKPPWGAGANRYSRLGFRRLPRNCLLELLRRTKDKALNVARSELSCSQSPGSGVFCDLSFTFLSALFPHVT
jgi:hypothetical protein